MIFSIVHYECNKSFDVIKTICSLLITASTRSFFLQHQTIISVPFQESCETVSTDRMKVHECFPADTLSLNHVGCPNTFSHFFRSRRLPGAASHRGDVDCARVFLAESASDPEAPCLPCLASALPYFLLRNLVAWAFNLNLNKTTLKKNQK